ncbi:MULTISPECIES: hypothetical protein [unclassified Alishewanella]|uniref:hypothetical protein n=1 Tax=unclassified Alishewanella TaxID=2628974 RepID=UPI0008236E54|nr:MULTISPECIES: hypothetical protein [unclassified Alishewanella]MCT8125372.1 hypothetical protein [Alishewanella sp. BS5-314]OCW92307.1 hypothetical protein A9165_16415 [Alishewanella sp. HH-ZS]
MTDQQLIRVLKVVMFSGFAIFMFGHYLWAFADLPAKMGIKGIIIVAGCCAFGLILSLPTKIYLTMLLMKWEDEVKKSSKP